MKVILVLLLLVSSVSSFATPLENKAEALRVANAILDNPQTVVQLKNEGVNIVDYSIVEAGNGVNTFTFNVDRTCFCMPKPGTLTIVQDLRPSFADGPILYTSSLIWKQN